MEEKDQGAPSARTASHTPGPWKIHGAYGRNKTEIGTGGRAVATVWTKVSKVARGDGRRPDLSDFVDEPEGVANLKLILAAPAFADAAWDARLNGWKHTRGCPSGECWCYRLGAALRSAGRLVSAANASKTPPDSPTNTRRAQGEEK